MPTITADDPHLVETKRVDKSGRVYIGRDVAEEDVQIIVVRKSGTTDGTTDANKVSTTDTCNSEPSGDSADPATADNGEN